MEHIFDEIPKELEGYKQDQKKWLRIWRHRYEPIVFSILREKYGRVLQDHWKSCVIPYQSNKAFVIVERRCHPNLDFILQNIAYFGEGWSIYLFCSKENHDFCRKILGHHRETIHLIPIFEQDVSMEEGVREYNQLLQTSKFWEQIEAEHICTMEMDCYLRKEIPEDLLEYDYVGTPWGWDLNSPGGTGLTLRRRSVMLTLCASCKKMEMQDSFVAQGIQDLGLLWLPAKPYGVSIFVESFFTEDPVGVHQWWTFVFNRFLDKKTLDIVWNYFTFELAKDGSNSN
jgi:hypothetical protein